MPKLREWLVEQKKELDGLDELLRNQPIWVQRLKDVGWIGVEGCIALGVTGPILRAAGLPWDLRKTEPYMGYETFDFEVPTDDRGDCWSRFVVKVAEMWESLKIVEQVLDRLEPGPVMVDDPKIGWPAKLSIGPDGMGNSLGPRAEDHEHLDGIVDPPLQARHRGLPGAGRAGLHDGRVAQGRAGCARRQRRRHPAVPRSPARAQLHQPAVDGGPGDRRPSGRRHRLRSPRSTRSWGVSTDERAFWVDAEWSAAGQLPDDVGPARSSGRSDGLLRPGPGRRPGDHLPLPRGPVALGAAADAASRPVRTGLRHARRHRVLRRRPGHHQGPGRGGVDLLHDVQAQADR